MYLGKTIRHFFFFLTVLILSASPAEAQWERLQTLGGFQARDLAVTADGTIALLGVANNDGIRLTTDRGSSWSHRADLDFLYISSLYAHGSDIFLLASNGTDGRGPKRIYRLASPTSAAAPVPAPRDGSVGTFCISDNGWFYATLEGNPNTDSVYVSMDAGGSWTAVCRKYADRVGKNALQVDPLGQLWSYDQFSIARWDPEAMQWLRWDGLGRTTSTSRWFYFRPNGDALICNGSRIDLLPASGGAPATLYQSTYPHPNIEFWMTATGAMLISDRAGDLSLFTQVFRASTDDGQTWAVIDSSRNAYYTFLGEHDGSVYVAVGSSVLRSEDLGLHFTDCTSGLSAVRILAFEVIGDRLHVLTDHFSLSGDAGATWTNIDAGAQSSWPMLITSKGTFLIMASSYLQVSRDSARTWTSPLPEERANMLQQFVTADDVIIGIFADSTIRRSTDEGSTWTVVHHTGGRAYSLQHAHGVFYALELDNLLRSTDHGVTWTSQTLPAMEQAFLFGNTRALFLNASSILWRSYDHGDTWNPLPLDTLTRRLHHVASNSRGDIAAIRMDSGIRPRSDVVFSSDDGETWQKITFDLPAAFTNSPIPIGLGVGFSATNRLFTSVPDRGLYSMDANILAASPAPPSPEALLLDVWPTVTSSGVQVGWEAGVSVHLQVTSVTGALLIDHSLGAATRSFHLDVSSWPAGTYFLHAAAGAKQTLRRFMILR